MIKAESLSFSPALPSDFEAFKTLRKKVMRPHVDRQGLPWIEAAEDAYHRDLFDEKGLRAVFYQAENAEAPVRIGFVGVKDEGGEIALSRFCLDPAYQGKGFGTVILEKIFKEKICQHTDVVLDALKMNPARALFERFGFVPVREDWKLVYYKKAAVKNGNSL